MFVNNASAAQTSGQAVVTVTHTWFLHLCNLRTTLLFDHSSSPLDTTRLWGCHSTGIYFLFFTKFSQPILGFWLFAQKPRALHSRRQTPAAAKACSALLLFSSESCPGIRRQQTNPGPRSPLKDAVVQQN